MEIPRVKTVVYILTFLGYVFSSYGSDVIDQLRDAVLMAEEYLGQLMKFSFGIVKKLGAAKDMLHASDDNCEFTCPSGGIPVKNKFHKPSFNGCGTDLLSLKHIEYFESDMKECCNLHDICYDTCNNKKKDCDDDFKQCLYKICHKISPVETLTKACKVAASMVSGSMTLGCQSYLESQKRSCYCPNDEKKRKFTPGGEL